MEPLEPKTQVPQQVESEPKKEEEKEGVEQKEEVEKEKAGPTEPPPEKRKMPVRTCTFTCCQFVAMYMFVDLHNVHAHLLAVA